MPLVYSRADTAWFRKVPLVRAQAANTSQASRVGHRCTVEDDLLRCCADAVLCFTACTACSATYGANVLTCSSSSVLTCATGYSLNSDKLKCVCAAGTTSNLGAEGETCLTLVACRLAYVALTSGLESRQVPRWLVFRALNSIPKLRHVTAR